MDRVSRISFLVRQLREYEPGVVKTIVPKIDGVQLSELVYAFEAECGFDHVGGYGGIIPSFFNYGPLDRYLMGDTAEDSFWAQIGEVYVLGCDCGEVGCWPLACRISLQGDLVRWNHFRQPHRAQRDYSRFGPFLFEAAQYREAVSHLQSEIQ